MIALANSAGLVTEKYAYTAYGQTVVTGSGTAAYRYTGRRWDAETGLYFYRARAYSPTLGRFLQADPINTAGGINLYAYVGNDPANLLDPMGLAAIEAREGTGIIDAVKDFFKHQRDLLSNDIDKIASDPVGRATSFLNTFPGTSLEGKISAGLGAAASGLIARNALQGATFEGQVLAAIGAAKNRDLINVPGMTRSSIPDAIGIGITEIKSGLEVNYTYLCPHLRFMTLHPAA